MRANPDVAARTRLLRERLILRIDVISLISRSEEHTSELQSHVNLVCRLLLEKKNRIALPALQRSALQAPFGSGGAPRTAAEPTETAPGGAGGAQDALLPDRPAAVPGASAAIA